MGLGVRVRARGTEGLTLHDDWDALGMRASGSQSITFEDCFVPDAFFNPQERAWGGLDEGLLTIQVNANLSLSAAMVGIAEQARDLVVEQVMTRRKAPSNRILAERTGIQYQVAEMEIDLATARAMIERTASLVDAYLLSHSASEVQLGGAPRADVRLPGARSGSRTARRSTWWTVPSRCRAVPATSRRARSRASTAMCVPDPSCRRTRPTRRGSTSAGSRSVSAPTWISDAGAERPAGTAGS